MLIDLVHLTWAIITAESGESNRRNRSWRFSICGECFPVITYCLAKCGRSDQSSVKKTVIPQMVPQAIKRGVMFVTTSRLSLGLCSGSTNDLNFTSLHTSEPTKHLRPPTYSNSGRGSSGCSYPFGSNRRHCIWASSSSIFPSFAGPP